MLNGALSSNLLHLLQNVDISNDEKYERLVVIETKYLWKCFTSTSFYHTNIKYEIPLIFISYLCMCNI